MHNIFTRLESIIEHILFSLAFFTTGIFLTTVTLVICGMDSFNFRPRILGEIIVHIFIEDGQFFVKYTWLGFILCTFLGGSIGAMKSKG